MNEVQVTIENENDILRLFQTLPPEIFEEVQNIMQSGADRLADRARENAPVRTGRLRDSILVEGATDIEPDDAFTPIAVVATAPYAGFVEDGTSKMTARPFMMPAVEDIEPEIMAEVDDILEEHGFTKSAVISED